MNDINSFPKMNMISVNVHGICTYVKHQKMFNWLARKKADIFSQKKKKKKKKLTVLLILKSCGSGNGKGILFFCFCFCFVLCFFFVCLFCFVLFFSHGTNHSKGVAILFKGNVDYEVKQCNIDKNG